MRIDAHLHWGICRGALAAVVAEIEGHRIFSISVSLDPETYAANKENARLKELVSESSPVPSGSNLLEE